MHHRRSISFLYRAFTQKPKDFLLVICSVESLDNQNSLKMLQFKRKSVEASLGKTKSYFRSPSLRMSYFWKLEIVKDVRNNPYTSRRLKTLYVLVIWNEYGLSSTCMPFLNIWGLQIFQNAKQYDWYNFEAYVAFFIIFKEILITNLYRAFFLLKWQLEF